MGLRKRKKRRNLPALPKTDTTIRTGLGGLIKLTRKSLDLDQVQFAGRVGVGSNTLRRWEYGQSQPTRRNFEAIVAYVRTINPDLAARIWADATNTPVPVPPPPSTEAFGAALHQLADDLDVSPRRVREGLSKLFTRLRAERFTMEAAHVQLEALMAAASKATPT